MTHSSHAPSPSESAKFNLQNLQEVFQALPFMQIPDYQRGYSWEERQRNDLLKDLEYLEQGNYTHYTGTIVAAVNSHVSNDSPCQIVDGQQRLTSLVLLLHVLLSSDKWNDEESKKAIIHQFILFDEETGNTKYRLKLNGELEKFFKKLIGHGGNEDLEIDNKSKQNLVDAHRHFSEWINESDTSPERWVEIIINRLGFLIYTPTKNAEIGIMFEVINNRGKGLSELEKVKNYLIYLASKNSIGDLRDAVNDNWGAVLENLNRFGWTNNDQEDSFLRNCWIVFKEGSKKKSHYVYYYLKEEYPAHQSDLNWRELIDFVEFMVKASESLKKLFLASSTESQESKILHHLRYQPRVASVLPLYLAVDMREKGEEKIALFDLIEKLNFRYYGTGIANRSDSGQGWLFYFANLFYRQYGNTIEYEGEPTLINGEWLKWQMVWFISTEANDVKFVKYLTLDKDESGDYFHWSGLKYFLANYEESLLAEKKKGCDLGKYLKHRDPKNPNDFFHREHIWAVKDYSCIDDQDYRDVNKCRLGNFILLKEGLNIKVSNDPVERKIEMYHNDSEKDLNTLMLLELVPKYWEMYGHANDEWSRRTKRFWRELNIWFLDWREERMVNFALNRWRVNELEKQIEKVQINSFTDKNEVYHFETGMEEVP